MTRVIRTLVYFHDLFTKPVKAFNAFGSRFIPEPED